jgi:hypothetical protein
MELASIFASIEAEYGKPLVVYPQGYHDGFYDDDEDEEIKPTGCSSSDDNYWIITERGDLSRTIYWVIGNMCKEISEVEGPAAIDCPLFFFDLVPCKNESWRESVREFWFNHSLKK